MLFPNTHMNHMFPIKCIQLPCMNIEVRMVSQPSPPTWHWAPGPSAMRLAKELPVVQEVPDLAASQAVLDRR